MRDIDQTPAAEEIERLRNVLARERKEFEEFVSMAAHNLRDSLRDVAANSQLMTETYAGRLDSEAGVLLCRIQEGAVRMQSLLSDVVDYWSPCAGESSRVDMETVLLQALLCADKQLTERGAVATHDPLPQVCGNFEILTKVLYHLIRNGVEFCEAPSPRIHISCAREVCEWVFSVQDNGPGIDPEFQGRLFGAFKRLHGKEHPGNGLGLAFCKKVIERYGGRMWLDATPGVGSIFYFTMAPADDDSFACG
jgi:light-regulated signal transduction histidine kinase (bacteriophytochrome)